MNMKALRKLWLIWDMGPIKVTKKKNQLWPKKVTMDKLVGC